MFQPSRILLFVALIPGVLVATIPSKFWTEQEHASKAASVHEPSNAFIAALR